MKTIAAILAGGTGKRFGETFPKQFLEIKKKPVLAHSIAAFEKNNNIDTIIVVVTQSYIGFTRKLIENYSFKKIAKVIAGGKERWESGLAAINSIAELEHEENCKLLIHDAARPYVSQKIITNVVRALEKNDAVAVGIPVTDTIFQMNRQRQLINVPERNYLYCAQTPQGFGLQTIKKAYRLAMNDSNFAATDDCSVVKKYLPEVPVILIAGDIKNKKITFKEDLL